MVRVTAGRFRGRRLAGPDGVWMRPTGDRVKQCIYNVLQDMVPGARVADLFSGTGNLGIEAWSRGASRVLLVDNAPRALALIARNVSLLGGGPEIEVIADDAVSWLRALAPRAVDLVLADPPYAAGLEEALLEALPAPAPEWFVLQHGKEWRLQQPPPGYVLWRSKRFGTTGVEFLRREEEEEEP